MKNFDFPYINESPLDLSALKVRRVRGLVTIAAQTLRPTRNTNATRTTNNRRHADYSSLVGLDRWRTDRRDAAMSTTLPVGAQLQVERLPKWAQQHIESLQCERDTAIRELNEWVDGQTESPVYVDELVSLGENRTDDGSNSPSFKRRYVQSHRVTFVHAGIKLEVALVDNHISAQWTTEYGVTQYIAAIPVSFQRLELYAKEHMR